MSLDNHLDIVAVTLVTSLFFSVSCQALVSIGNLLDIVALTLVTSLFFSVSC